MSILKQELSDSAPAPPPVTAVVATRDRPELVRRTLRSILAQDYPGEIHINVVFDQSEIDPFPDLVIPENRKLHLMLNSRQPGLAGARNTGILAATGTYVAFCDDDDEWFRNRISAQVAAWEDDPGAAGISSAIIIESPGGSHMRVPNQKTSFEDFLKSRVTAIHTSTFLWRREDLITRFGMIDEDLPAAYGEDYDLLLRATKYGHIHSVSQPLVTVHWNRASFFDQRWYGIANGLEYLLRKHPEFARSPRGTARIAAQVAFAHAAVGDRANARRWAHSALRRDSRQPRAYAALAVAYRLLSAAMLVRFVNRRGRGL